MAIRSVIGKRLRSINLIEQLNGSDRIKECTSLSWRQKPTSGPSSQCRSFHFSPAVCGGGKRDFKQKHGKKKALNQQKKSPPGVNPNHKGPNKQQLRKFNKSMKQHEELKPKQIPPALLTRTASPYVYIAKPAIMNEHTGEMCIDPLTLFSEMYDSNNSSTSDNPKKRSIIPRIFRQSHLEYFSPASFPNHEPPTDGTPEVCFLGRSNTGKSSLINAMHSTIRSNAGSYKSSNASSGGGELARTSKTPGRTQTINYFGLVSNTDNDSKPTAKLFLVDLPGFGYASAPDESVDEWQKRTQQFLISRTLIPEERVNVSKPWGGVPKSQSKARNNASSTIQHDATSPPLKRLYLLLDSRLPEPQYLDLSVMSWCDDYSIPYTVVLTKVDGSSRAHCVKLTNQLCMRYHSLVLDQKVDEDGEEDGGQVFMDPIVLWTSAKDGLGIEELLSSVEANLFDLEDDDGDDDSDFPMDVKEMERYYFEEIHKR